jgi:hypothetical protein
MPIKSPGRPHIAFAREARCSRLTIPSLTLAFAWFPNRSHRPRAFERKRRGEIRALRKRIFVISATNIVLRPGLRHPAGPIQATNFRSAIAF